MWQEQCKGRRTKYRKPYYVFAAKTVTEWTTQQGAGSYGCQENKQMQLCLADR